MTSSRTILTIDIGNTAMKTCMFDGERLVQSVVIPGCSPEPVETLLTFHSVDGIAYCCVGKDTAGIAATLREEGEIPFVELTASSRLPIAVDYATPDTLGMDRLAAAIGAWSPGQDVLVVDAGTALTSDLVADDAFKGGNISPGIGLRFRSLNKFTSRLPLVGPEGPLPQVGNDTVTAIRSGVVGGVVAQIAADFHFARLTYENIKMILSGGNAEFLAPLLRERGIDPVVDRNLVGKGLVRVFNCNYNE